MRGAFLATAAAALMGSAVADVAHMRRHGHDSFHHRRNDVQSSSVIGAPGADATCGCTTKVITYYGSPTWVPVATPEPEPTTTITSKSTVTQSSTSYSTVTVVASPSSSPAPAPEPSTPSSVPPPAPSTPASPAPVSTAPVLPTPGVTSFSSTGTYTIPATTLTVTDTTTVCGATTTDLPSGSHTYGGVTTVVETSTTVTCPYATVKPSGTTVTSVLETTTYVCPSAGTYTIAPTTTSIPTSTVMVYPTPHTFTPGTYTQPEQTVTATRTDYTYVCPTFTPNAPTTSPQPPVNTVPATTASPSPPANTPTNTPSVPPVSGEQMGMTYSPYANDGGCKAKSDILKDIALVKQKGFTHVRVYSTDCHSLEWIGEGCKQHGLKMIVGVFIDGSGIQGAQSQVTAIAKWAQWEMVTLIVVGNEAISSGVCSAGELAGFVESSKKKFEQAGYHGEVTTTEPINIWQQYGSTLCPAVDIIGANIHPFFNNKITAKEAGNFVKGEVKELRNICKGKDVINLETGWPSKGNANGAAVPSREDQITAVKGIQSAFGSNSVFFSYSNDLWKSPGPYDVEQYWGCIDVF